VPARHQHHARDPRGVAGRRGALGLSGIGPRRLIVRTDGAARGNPGPASAGAVLIDADAPGAERPDAPPIATVSEALGRQTNNVAEYTGVLRALALAEELGAEEVALLLDSMLIVEQLRGRWRVKDAKLAPLHADALARLGRFRRWSARHVPRSENRAADALANEALDRVAAGGPAVVIRRPGEGIRSEAAPRVADAAETEGDPALGPGVPTSRRPAGRDQLPLGLEPGFDPGDSGPGAGELRIRVLGSGTSTGVPRIACDCATCTSDDPRDRRLRASVLLAWGARRIVIDCGPDFRAQALAADLDRLDAVLLTHEHQDSTGGLDDLRSFNELAGDYLPVHALAPTLEAVMRRFAYAFEPGQSRFRGLPMLRPMAIDGPFEIAGRRFVPVPVIHGDVAITGFRTGGLGYISDVKRIEAPSLALLRDLDVLIVSALRERPHPTHQTVDEALAVIAELRPRRAFLTHLDHDLRHATLAARLPAGVEIAVDGLELRVPR
jgi:phosphoribosyl 1,2-cyclic phosphate phosphodiesterase